MQVHVIQSAKGLSCVKVEWELWGSELIVTQSPPSRLPPRVTTAGLPTVLGSCDILPVDLLALVALWPQKAASAVNHVTFPVS